MTNEEISFRDAAPTDLETLVALLADDPLGSGREDPGADGVDRYRSAFEAIARDPNHRLLVGELGGEVVAVLQLSFLPHLTYAGGWRAQVEGVRVSERVRSRGVGRALLSFAIELARERGCHLVQLTTDRRRPEALAFYRRLGFQDSHHGMKLHLANGPVEA